MTTQIPKLKGQALYFDLSGTLMELDSLMPALDLVIFERLASYVGVICLVTGQPRRDPQVDQVFSIFSELNRNFPDGAEFRAYTTRGGIRWLWRGKQVNKDVKYCQHYGLSEKQSETIFNLAYKLLKQLSITPLIPIECIDNCAVRVNLEPDNRPHFSNKLAKLLPEFQVVIEGRTSVFVMNSGAGKKAAMNKELLENSGKLKMLYFGNEFEKGGNDRDILDLHEIFPFRVGAKVKHNTVLSVGENPSQMFAMLDQALTAEAN